MPKFMLITRETVVRVTIIQADSLKEAMKKQLKGLTIESPETRFITRDIKTWTAEDDQGRTYDDIDLAKVVKELNDEQKQEE